VSKAEAFVFGSVSFRLPLQNAIDPGGDAEWVEGGVRHAHMETRPIVVERQGVLSPASVTRRAERLAWSPPLARIV
jgi:hypothetical protein